MSAPATPWTTGPLIVAPGGCQTVTGFLAVVRDFEDGTTSVPTAYVAQEDDAHLYAAAPDLYEALATLLASIDEHDPQQWSVSTVAYSAAQTALAHARRDA